MDSTKLNVDSLIDLEKHSVNNSVKVDVIKFRKMTFLYNAIQKGWTVKKRNDSYVFTKIGEGKKEVLEESYLLKFITSNIDVTQILS